MFDFYLFSLFQGAFQVFPFYFFAAYLVTMRTSSHWQVVGALLILYALSAAIPLFVMSVLFLILYVVEQVLAVFFDPLHLFSIVIFVTVLEISLFVAQKSAFVLNPFIGWLPMDVSFFSSFFPGVALETLATLALTAVSYPLLWLVFKKGRA